MLKTMLKIAAVKIQGPTLTPEVRGKAVIQKWSGENIGIHESSQGTFLVLPRSQVNLFRKVHINPVTSLDVLKVII